MKIDLRKITNPYLLAYVNAFGIKDGEEIKAVNYMTWIDGKHSEYRRKRGLPDHIDLNEEEIKEFCCFLGL